MKDIRLQEWAADTCFFFASDVCILGSHLSVCLQKICPDLSSYRLCAVYYIYAVIYYHIYLYLTYPFEPWLANFLPNVGISNSATSLMAGHVCYSRCIFIHFYCTPLCFTPKASAWPSSPLLPFWSLCAWYFFCFVNSVQWHFCQQTPLGQ